MNDDAFHIYVALQGIIVQRPGADADFIRECTLARIAAFLSHGSCTVSLDFLRSLQPKFKAEIAQNRAFAEEFNKIRDGIRNTYPKLLPKFNLLFGLRNE
jgi:hypothetical protein